MPNGGGAMDQDEELMTDIMAMRNYATLFAQEEHNMRNPKQSTAMNPDHVRFMVEVERRAKVRA